MDIDKSLYMSNFLKMRDDIGCVEIYKVNDVLNTNLYDEIKPNKQVIEEIQEIHEPQKKFIQLLKKEDQHVFFPDLPELEPKKPIEEEIKKINLKETIDPLVNNPETKQIFIDPNYVAKNE